MQASRSTRHEARCGFVAVYSHDAQAPVTEAELAALVESYLKVRPGGRVRHAPAAAGLRAAVIAVAGTPGDGLAVDGDSWAAFVGAIYAVGPLTAAALADLDGHFGLLRYDARDGSARVATDPLGMQSVFVVAHNGRTYVSTSALALARHLRLRVDPLGAATFLRAGFLFGALTQWDGVRRLEPGQVVTLHGERTSTDLYWRFAPDRAVTRLTLDGAIDHGLDVLRSTSRSYLGDLECAWADLSGGFDSRLLVLALASAGVTFRASTRGEPGGAEPRVAAEIARLRGWDWTLFSYPTDWRAEMAPLWEQTLSWSDGFQPLGELAQRMWKHTRTSQVCPVLVGGGAGEIFRNSASQQEFRRAGKTTQVNLDNAINMRWLHPIGTGAFLQDPTAEIRADFRRKLTAWTEPYRGELNTLQLDLMYAYKSTGTLGVQASMERSVHTRHWPYLYRPVFVAALSTSHRHRVGHRLERRMIERLDPRVAAVETSPWGGPATPLRVTNAHRFIPHYYDIGRRASLKLAQKATRSGVGRPPANERRLAANMALVEHADAVAGQALTHGSMRSGSLYRKAELEALLAEARAGRRGNADLVDRVLTMELALHAADASLER